MAFRLLRSAWRRFRGIHSRKPDPAVPDPFRYGLDERLRWHPPAEANQPRSWIDRPERDRLRRDLHSYPHEDR